MLYLKSVDLKKEKIESLVIPVCEDKNIHEDKTIRSLIRKAKKIKAFRGGKDDEVALYNLSEVKAESIIFLGLGKLDKIDMEAMRAMSGKAAKGGFKKEFSEIFIAVPPAGKMNVEMPSVLEAMMEGAFLGNHIFDKYKKEKKHKPLKKINFLVKADAAEKYSKLPSKVETVCRGTILAREWV
ncbi:MAG TPA: M17 family peptidase N-terminal domain-containing protein, partial [Desulfobacterales bacterium]|nr:M17 family peptidase N-terminal domain-containing protein [Desulfobacterales bacterium]